MIPHLDLLKSVLALVLTHRDTVEPNSTAMSVDGKSPATSHAVMMSQAPAGTLMYAAPGTEYYPQAMTLANGMTLVVRDSPTPNTALLCPPSLLPLSSVLLARRFHPK